MERGAWWATVHGVAKESSDSRQLPDKGRGVWHVFHRIQGRGIVLKRSCPARITSCCHYRFSVQFSSVQSLNHVQLFEIPWTAACQASLSIINSRSSLKLTSIESVMPSSHLILGRPLLLLPLIPSSIRVFSSESGLHIRWSEY